MRSNAPFVAAHLKGTGKSRVFWLPSVAAARAEPRLFQAADAIDIHGLRYIANRTSILADNGTETTENIQLSGVSVGRFILFRATTSGTVRGRLGTSGVGLCTFVVPGLLPTADISVSYVTRAAEVLTPLDLQSVSAGSFTVRGDTLTDSTSIVLARWSN